MVKRYSAYADNTHAYEDIDGAFVKYEDYERLQSAVNALLTDIRTRYSMGEDGTFKCEYLRDLESIIK